VDISKTYRKREGPSVLVDRFMFLPSPASGLVMNSASSAYEKGINPLSFLSSPVYILRR
jgi:hypothetical protein